MKHKVGLVVVLQVDHDIDAGESECNNPGWVANDIIDELHDVELADGKAKLAVVYPITFVPIGKRSIADLALHVANLMVGPEWESYGEFTGGADAALPG